jgi:hypothetical protein
MTPVCSVYSQLLQLFPRGQFAQAVKQHRAERNAGVPTDRSSSVGRSLRSEAGTILAVDHG